MKHAIVTGAAGGLGRTIADQLADEGWAVGLLDMNQAAIEKSGADPQALPGDCLRCRRPYVGGKST